MLCTLEALLLWKLKKKKYHWCTVCFTLPEVANLSKTHSLPRASGNLMQQCLWFTWFTIWVQLWLIRNQFTSCWEGRVKGGKLQGLVLVSSTEMSHLITYHSLSHESSPWTKCYALAHQVDQKYNTHTHAHTGTRGDQHEACREPVPSELTPCTSLLCC